MQLDDYLKSKVRYHLGFNAGAQIPAGDRARLEEAMALVPDELVVQPDCLSRQTLRHCMGSKLLQFQMTINGCL